MTKLPIGEMIKPGDMIHVGKHGELIASRPSPEAQPIATSVDRIEKGELAELDLKSGTLRRVSGESRS